MSCDNARRPIHPGLYASLQEASAIVERLLGHRNSAWLHRRATCKRRAEEPSMTSSSASDYSHTIFCMPCLYTLIESERARQQLRLSV